MIGLFALLIFGHQLLLLFTKRRFNPFDVKVLLDVVLLTMWVFAPLSDSSLRFRLENDLSFAFTTFLGIVFLYAGLHLPVWRQNPDTWLLSDPPILRMRWLWLALFVFVVATLAVSYQKIQYSGVGIWGYLTGDRIAAYRTILNEGSEGSAVARLISFTHPVILFWLAASLQQRHWKRALVLYLIILVGIVMIATTRLPVIITLLIPVAYYYQGSNRSLPIPAATLVACISIFLLYFLNILRTRGLDSALTLNISLGDAIGALGANFNPMRGYEMLWQLDSYNQLSYEYGLSYWYVPLTAVPRALWAAKPLVSFEPRWTTYLFGQHFAMTSEGWGVWTFTVWGEGLVQFGIFGVFFNLFLYGSLVAWAYHRFSRNPKFSLVWFYYSILAATYLRSSFSALAWTFFAAFLPLMFIYYLSTWQESQASIKGQTYQPAKY